MDEDQGDEEGGLKMKKKIALALILAAGAALMSGCAGRGVRIRTGAVRFADVVLAVRAGYEYADDLYDISQREDGYDIIIHFTKEGGQEP